MTVKTKMIHLLPVIFLLSEPAVHAGTWYVYPDIENSGTGSSWEQAKKTIHEALGASLPGDTILVGYDESSGTRYPLAQGLHLNRPVKMRSARFGMDGTYDAVQSDSSLCIIDAQNTCRPVLIFPQSDVYSSLYNFSEFIGFTVIHGNATHETIAPGRGGGICIMGRTSPLISHCLIDSNTAAQNSNAGYGGGICCDGDSASPVLQELTVTRNVAARFGPGSGGGIAIIGGADAEIRTALFQDNQASWSYYPGQGGGIFIQGSGTSLLISGSTIQRNTAALEGSGSGGGICLSGAASLDMTGCTVDDNLASSSSEQPGKGGGIFCSGLHSFPYIANSIIRRNFASRGNEGMGGGVCITDSSGSTLFNCEIDSNTASAGSMSFSGFGGGICILGDSTRPVIQSTVITMNLASEQASGYGGGLAFLEGASGSLSESQILDNAASSSAILNGMGGGICCSGKDTDPVLRNNIIMRNHASLQTRGYGGGLGIFENASPSAEDNDFKLNTASENQGGFGGGIACGNGTQTHIENNRIEENTASIQASGYGGGIYFFKDASSLCQENILTGNYASLSALDLGMGGGICIEHEPQENMHIVLEQNQFERNIASTKGSGQGGALAVSGSGSMNASVIYNSFRGNVAASDSERFGLGGAIYLSGYNNETVIRNNLFEYNLEDSAAHIEGHGSGLYINSILPDTSIRNNLWMNNGTGDNCEVLFSTLSCSVTHNAFYGNPIKYNDLIRSLHEVNGNPMIDPDTMTPLMDSPLVDAGYDPVITMDERASGWYLDIGIQEFNGILVKKKCAPGQESRFAGQVRASLLNVSFHDTVRVTIEVHPGSRHPLDSYGVNRWYHIDCDPALEGKGDLILSYAQEDCRLLDEHSLKLWHYDQNINNWQGPLFTMRDTATNWVRAPFTDLAGDWIITDAKDMNALHASVFDLIAVARSEGIRIEWSVASPCEILSMSVLRTDDGERFTELEGPVLQIDPAKENYYYLDHSAQPDREYGYKIKLNYLNGLSEYSQTLMSASLEIPEKTRLLPNFPNPFNHKTRFYYELSESGHVSLVIRDIRGRLIDTLVSETQTAGLYQISWDGTDSLKRPAESGIYIYHLETLSYEKTGKMLILR